MASGNTLLIFTPLSNEPPASNFATPDTRNAHPVLDFDDTTNESLIFTAVMPQNYAGGGITVLLGYSMTSAITNDVFFQFQIERIGDEIQDVDADSFINTNFSVDTVPGTSGHVKYITRLVTDGAALDFVVAGDLFRIKILRVAADAADTATGDAELHFIEIRET